MKLRFFAGRIGDVPLVWFGSSGGVCGARSAPAPAQQAGGRQGGPAPHTPAPCQLQVDIKTLLIGSAAVAFLTPGSGIRDG